jgi:hypothetical protein
MEKTTSIARKACVELIRKQIANFEGVPDVPNVSSDPTEGAFEFVWTKDSAVCRGYSDKRVVTYLHIGGKTFISSQAY